MKGAKDNSSNKRTIYYNKNKIDTKKSIKEIEEIGVDEVEGGIKSKAQESIANFAKEKKPNKEVKKEIKAKINKS
jgi:hypothetical protein